MSGAGGNDQAPAPAPDLTDAVLGFRIWSLRPTGRLGAIVAGSFWVPGINEAVCNPGSKRVKHRAPAPGCGCGFNAYFSPDGRLFPKCTEVLGAIAAWGEIDVYAAGFRAQYAQVIAISHPEPARGPKMPAQEWLDAASEHYGVPIVPRSKLRPLALQQASPLSSVLIPREETTKRRHPAPRPPARPPMPPPAPVEVATWKHARGHAIWVRRHVAVLARDSAVRIGLAPGAAAVADPEPEVSAVPPGAQVEAGDVVATLPAAYPGHTIHICTPVGGKVKGLNPAFAADLRNGDRAVSSAPWLVEIEPEDSPLEDAPLLWSRPAVELYRQGVARQSDAGVLAELTAPRGSNPATLTKLPEAPTPIRPALAAHQRSTTSLDPEDGRRAAIMVEHLRPLLQALGEDGTLLAA